MKIQTHTVQRIVTADETAAWGYAYNQLSGLLDRCKHEPLAIRKAIEAAFGAVAQDDCYQPSDAVVMTTRLNPQDMEQIQEIAIESAEMAIYAVRQKTTVTRTQESRALNLIRNALWLPLPTVAELRIGKVSAEQAEHIARLVVDEWVTNAWHEAGHVVVLGHYGYYAKARIWDSGVRRLEATAIKGRTRWVNLPELSAFGLSVFGWAGLIATKLLEEPKANDRDLWNACNSGDTSDLSESDQRHIYSHPQIWRTFKTAAGILIRNYEQLKTIADELHRTHRWDSRNKQEAPKLPEPNGESSADAGGQTSPR